MRADQPRTGARRWALLATSLALLGVALAARGGSATTSSSARPHQRPAKTTTTLEAQATAQGEATTTGAAASSPRMSEATSGSASSSATTSTTTPPTSRTTVAPLSPAAASEQIVQGWLLGPTAISASYARSSSTTGAVTATWSGATTLTLSADCPAGQSSRSGPSPLVVVATGPGCTISLAGPADVTQSSFSIDLGPA